MTIRTIMMPTAAERDDPASMERAIEIARLFSAHLDVIFVRPDPEEAVLYSGVLSTGSDSLAADMRDCMNREGRTVAERSRRAFASLCRKACLEKAARPQAARTATAAWHQIVGEPFVVVPKAAQGADMAVFTPQTAKYRLTSQNVLESTLLRSGRPVLYTPAGGEPLAWSPALIAWDGSASCARAIAAWLAGGPPVREATLVHVADGRERCAPTDAIEKHLGWHGVACDVHTPLVGTEVVGKVIADTAARLARGLVVMGGYGHLRNWEAAFGGVTRYMIRHAPLPTLMMH